MKIFVNGKEVKGKFFAYDGCHKIYICEDMGDIERARNTYHIEPIEKLKECYYNSCELRFINNWKLTTCYAKQEEVATITYETETTDNINVNDEIMEGKPSDLLRYLQTELANSILAMELNDLENTCDNMRLFADVLELLEEHINDEYIKLKYNPMGAWYIDNDN